MRQHSWSHCCSLLIAMCVIVTVLSCSKTGPEGPAGAKGDKGDKGDTGAKGPTGTANVIYSNWIYAANFVDSIVDNSQVKVGHLYAPGISADILNSGAVLVYFNYGAGVFALPYTSYAGGKASTVNFTPGLKKIIITRFTLDNSNSIPLSTVIQYRYILIPGGVAGRQRDAYAGLDWNNYEQVKAFFSIPD